MSERTAGSNQKLRTLGSGEEPREAAGLDDVPDWPAGVVLSDQDDLVDDAAVEELSTPVADADRVEDVLEFGWGNRQDDPIDFGDEDPKADL